MENLPILLFSDGRDPVYDSSHIQESIVQKYADKSPSLLTGDIDTDLQARQIQTLAQGFLDAFVLAFFESSRASEKQSAEWLARQQRKIDGGMKAFEGLVRKRRPEGSQFLLGDEFTIGDIAMCCAVAHIEFAGFRPGWQDKYAELARYWEHIEERESFRATRPVNFDLRTGAVV